MANHKSADKRARQSKVKQAINSRVKSIVRTSEKKILGAIAAGNKDEAKVLFKDFSSTVDRATKRGIFHKNKAARKIGRMALKL